MRAAALALLVLATGACAMSRVGDAQVLWQQGQPCFGVTAAEADAAPDLRLSAVLVYDLTEQPPQQVWSLLGRPQGPRMTLSAGACLRYGHVPDGYEGPAPLPLQAGHAYEVFLNAAPASGRRQRHGYDARFCLRPGGVQPLPPNAAACQP
jgi:hypothetical protein